MNKKRRRIYVAGKYSDPDVINVLRNIGTGIKVCASILKNGDSPFCPWLDYQFQFFEQSLTVEDYYKYSLDWLEVSDEVWVLPNSENSKGTQKEIQRATELGIKITYLDLRETD